MPKARFERSSPYLPSFFMVRKKAILIPESSPPWHSSHLQEGGMSRAASDVLGYSRPFMRPRELALPGTDKSIKGLGWEIRLCPSLCLLECSGSCIVLYLHVALPAPLAIGLLILLLSPLLIFSQLLILWASGCFRPRLLFSNSG